MRFLENVKIKAAHHLDSEEACIRYFSNQVIFNLFKSNKLSDQQSKDAFIAYCNENYKHYEGTDDEFKNLKDCVIKNKLKDDEVIKWYTRQTFFYRLLNGVLRKDNICEIFNIRYGINQLTNVLDKYKYELKTDSQIVYRQ